MSFGGSGSVSKSKIEIPKFLRPLFKSAAGYGEQTLNTLSSLTDPNRESVAGFSPAEEIAQILGIQRALDPNSGFGVATDVFRGAAEGTPLSEFLDPAALESLQGFAGGESALAGSDSIISRLLGSDVTSQVGDITDYLGGAGGRGHLEDVVSGKYLYGGEGFDAALDAAMKRILPQVQTQFGRSGAGGGTGTLAAEAFGDRAAEQFAMQYGQERSRQDSAAGLLEQLGLSEAGLIGDMDLAKAGLNLQETGMLGDFLNSRDSLSSSASQILAGLGADERTRALAAAEALPGIENLDLSLLSGIGADQRNLEQRRLDAPLNNAIQFLNAIFGVNAFGQPVGQRSRSDSTQLGGGIVPAD